LETGSDDPNLRVVPQPDRRAVFVASHTESVHMSPTTLTDLGMALAWEGFDVDLIPYGQAVTPADLEDTTLVVVLPVVDYPSPDGDPTLYDDEWDREEIAALEAYVAGGGLLVLSNSAHRLKYANSVLDPNEDWRDANPLATRFGVSYHDGTLSDTQAEITGDSPLVEGIETLELAAGNGVPFSLTGGQVLVLVLTDVGLLGAGEGEPVNLPFWRNLAQYVRSR
jgi:hypothetical protein